MTRDELPSAVALHNEQIVHGYIMGILRPDGNLVWLRINAAPVYQDKTLMGAMAVFDDITEQYETQRRYREVLSLIGKAMQQINNPTTEARVRLTKREREVLRLVAQGHTNGEIASKLSISKKTVSSRLTNIYDKLDTQNRVRVALYALRHGLADLGDQSK